MTDNLMIGMIIIVCIVLFIGILGFGGIMAGGFGGMMMPYGMMGGYGYFSMLLGWISWIFIIALIIAIIYWLVKNANKR